MSIETGKCECCGARIPAKEWNPWADKQACDVVCKRALIGGRSRGEEIELEEIQRARYWRERHSLDAILHKLELVVQEEVNYNRPYMYQPV